MGSLNTVPTEKGVATLAVTLHFVWARTLPEGLEAHLFLKPNKLYSTLMHKIWTKAKQLQHVSGYTKYSPIWNNHAYPELVKLQCAAQW